MTKIAVVAGVGAGLGAALVRIDGMLDTPHVRATGIEADEPLLDVDAVAQAYWDLTQQDKGAWAFEIDMRPHDEDFFG
jgi:hypothetical protein